MFVKNTFPRHLTLDGLRVAVDCANGSAYRVAPEVLSELGASVMPLAVDPDGENINRDCGALHPEVLARTVVESRCHLGIALDGDADRAILVDETGSVVDGDEVLTMAAAEMLKQGTLAKKTVVATVMSNLGLDLAIEALGGRTVRDGRRRPLRRRRDVARPIQSRRRTVGARASSSITTTTGDGLITALFVLALVVERGRTLSELRRVMQRTPQVLLNVRVSEKREIAELPLVRQAIRAAESALERRGRVLVRYSGTETLARVMIEGENTDQIRRLAEDIVSAFRSEVGVD